MDVEVIKPEKAPKGGQQAFSPFGCFLAASGAALLAFCLIGAAAAASVWAFSKTFGLPDIVLQILFAAAAIPVLILTVWTGGRAWHIEQRLAQGADVDVPVFSFAHYWRKRA